MKHKVFNKGKGWYIICTNVKNDNDVAFLSVAFMDEPIFVPDKKGEAWMTIDVLEERFVSNNKKIKWVIKDYNEIARSW